MNVDQNEFTESESEVLEGESRDARALDLQLAAALGRELPRGATSSRGYLRGLTGRAGLSPVQERGLVAAAQSGDSRARSELVEAFLPQIAGVARAYRGSSSITRVELIQEGVVGLLRALERYDASIGTPFWAYASWWVRQAMQQLVAELTRPTVLSDRALRQLARVKTAHRALAQRYGREPTGRELVAECGLSEAHVIDLLAADGIPVSLQEPVGAPDGEVGAFGELLADPLADDAYEELLQASEIEQVRALLGSLSERERMVLRGRYGIDGPEQSLRELGERLGVSHERVRQIEDRALGKLRGA